MAYSRTGNDEFKGATGSTGAKLAETASNLADKATSKIGQVVENAESTAAAVAEQGREAGERVQEVAGNMKNAVNKSVKEQPMATLAVAAALGFVLGALWKS